MIYCRYDKQKFIIFVVLNGELIYKVEEDPEELEALIEHEKNNMSFYVRYWDRLNLSEKEMERIIDVHLDRMIVFMKRLKRTENFFDDSF